METVAGEEEVVEQETKSEQVSKESTPVESTPVENPVTEKTPVEQVKYVETKEPKIVRRFQEQLKLFTPMVVHGNGYEIGVRVLDVGDVEVATLPNFSDRVLVAIGSTYKVTNREVYIRSASRAVVEIIYYELT